MISGSVVADRPGQSLLIGFHDVAGAAHHMVELAQRLPEGWGALVIEAGDRSPDEPAPTVPAIAEAYLELASRRLGSGLTAVAGWGFGGLVAIEAARLLARAGAPCRLIAIATVIPRPEWRSRATDLASLAGVYIKHVAAWSGADSSAGLDPALGPVEGVHTWLRQSGLAPAGGEAAVERALQRFQRNVQALLGYEPAAIDVSTTVLFPRDEPQLAAMREAWTRVAPGHRACFIPGDHLDAVLPRHRTAVGDELAQVLATP